MGLNMTNLRVCGDFFLKVYKGGWGWHPMAKYQHQVLDLQPVLQHVSPAGEDA